MIKGVGRYAVEVESEDSEFFERVICFVRPQYACGSALDLHREAARMADNLSGPGKYTQQDIPQNRQKRSGGWLPLLLSAGGGAAAAMLITAIF